MKTSMMLKIVACAVAFVNAQNSGVEILREARQAAPGMIATMSQMDGGVQDRYEYAKDKAGGFFSEKDALPDGFREELKQAVDTAVAQELKMDLAQLKEAMSDPSTSVAALAESTGVDLESVKEGALQNFLAAAVSNGVLAEEQADRVADRFHNQGSIFDGGRGEGKKFGKKMGKKMGKKFEKHGKDKGGKKGRKKGGKKSGKGKDGERMEKLEGLREAAQEAVDEALSSAGIEIPEKPTKAEKKAMYEQAKAANLDLKAIKEAASEAFVTAGVEAGTISEEAAAQFFEKDERHDLREEMEDQIELAVASALDISVEELENLHEEGRDALKQMVEGSGVDLEATKASATNLFLDEAVADGRMSEEEAAKIRERNGKKGGKTNGSKGRKNGGGKPQKGGDKGNRKDGNRGDRPQKGEKGGKRGDRPQKGGERGDRPQKGEKGGNRGDRPQKGGERGDRPKKGEKGGNWGDRPQKGGERGDRPQKGGKRGGRS